ncbi:Carbon-nitrogen hydrolase [Pseudocyphellaria aurata]|nr:Carbon-nitrogen hydrolase [Pseudocyphellaria aurata]
MRVACLQFSAKLGMVGENMTRANELLQEPQLEDLGSNLDLLILPELAFTGYNFLSFEAISPYLEPTAAGASFEWAKATAARLQCTVTVGYPERSVQPAGSLDAFCYNSTVTVSSTGQVLAHYRKTHLYYTDEHWAQESPTRWLTTEIVLPRSPDPIRATFGICMDLNPYKFTAPWTLYELCSHAIETQCQYLLLSMAWLTEQPSSSLIHEAERPDLETMGYWCSRLQPLIDHPTDVIVVIANRCGEEPPQARYAGTSWIGRVGQGRIEAWGMLGRGEENVLVADLTQTPQWTLRSVQ